MVQGEEGWKSAGVLADTVAWLVINSMRSEQVQWAMLCVQNVANVYRKNAFLDVTDNTDLLCHAHKPNTAAAAAAAASEAGDDKDGDKNDAKKAEDGEDGDGDDVVDPDKTVDPARSMAVFDEIIDFSLEAAVPDPVPFEDKLRGMLEDHDEFIRTPAQHKIGQAVLVEVGQFSMLNTGAANRLDTEQEREQEQEQEKEVQARRDQQIEVEKFVDREYSRQEEKQKPWPLTALARRGGGEKGGGKGDPGGDEYPFYPLRDFKLRHQEPLDFPPSLKLSRNYFNPEWRGLRRVKNVIMVLEFAPSVKEVRLLTAEEAKEAGGGSWTRRGRPRPTPFSGSTTVRGGPWRRRTGRPH